MGAEEKKSNTLQILLGWAGIVLCVYFLVGLSAGQANAAACPDKVEGSEDAQLEVKYFYQSSCPYCWKQEPVINDIVKEHGDNVKVSHYNSRSCGEEVNKYSVRGTPTLVFENNGEESIIRGFLDNIAFKQQLCNHLGICK